LKKNVKFGDTTTSGDIEPQSFDKRGSMSGSNKSWECLMMAHYSDNNILKILESATASDHGSGSLLGSASKSQGILLRWMPMGLRFDEQSRRVNKFVVEMSMLSRLRHPCITTVMGAVVSNKVDPMLVM
jgi:ADP-ribosylglycohydrolase